MTTRCECFYPTTLSRLEAVNDFVSDTDTDTPQTQSYCWQLSSTRPPFTYMRERKVEEILFGGIQRP